MKLLSFLLFFILASLYFLSVEAGFQRLIKRPQQYPQQQFQQDMSQKYPDYDKFLYAKRHIDTFEVFED